MITAQKTKIINHCEITSSKRVFAHEYLDSGVPFYRGKEISEKQRSPNEINDQIFISREKFNEIKSKYGAPIKGDLLLTSVGTIGNPYLVKEGEEFYFKDGNLTWFRNFKDLNSQWLYYWLLSPQGKKELNKCTIGASQKAYTINLLEGMEFDLLPFPTQNQIASVLSAYDDLIENNEKRIKALEEMAQLLYTEWFVKFKFPGHEKIKLVDSGTSYGKIPEGWEVVKIGDRFETILGGTPSRSKQEFWNNGIVPWINSGEVNNLRITEASELITEKALEKSAAKMMPKRTTVLAITGATLGQVSLTEIKCCANQSVIGVFDKSRLLNEYIYLRIKNEIESIIALAGGGAQQHINKEIVNNKTFLIPDKKISERFAGLITPNFDEISKFIFNNHNLSQTRDLLIPQLVTGKRELKNI